MIDISKGRYWDEGIQLVDGCTPCSPGCDHCWSAAITRRFDGKRVVSRMLVETNGAFHGLLELHPDRLHRFNTRKPKVFAIWNDLFHEDVPESFQYEVWKAMIKNWQNTYLILTKRPAIMARFLSPQTCFNKPEFPHIICGLTVCNQPELDEKWPIFAQVPGKKFLSIEPMLGAIDFLYQALWRVHVDGNGIEYDPPKPIIDAIILGGETGPGARPLNPDWVRSVRDQCASAGVPFFFKSFGTYKGFEDWKIPPGRILDGRTHDDLPWIGAKK